MARDVGIMNFRKLQKKSLIVNQIIVVAILLVLAGTGYSLLQTMILAAESMGQSKDLVADILPPPLYLIEAQLVSSELLQGDHANRKALLEKLSSLKKDYDTRNQYWLESNLDQNLRSSLMGDQKKYADLFWIEVLTRFIPAVEAGQNEAAQNSLQALREYYGLHRKGVDVTVIAANEHAVIQNESLLAAEKTGKIRLFTVVFLGCAMVLIFAVPTINQIYASLHQAEEAAAAIAGGDLTYSVPTGQKNEVAKLLNTLELMRVHLKDLIKGLLNNVKVLSDAASELVKSANDGAVATEREYDASSSIAAAIEELSVSFSQVDAHATAAYNVTQSVVKESIEGEQIIHSTTTEMLLISGAVKDTSKTIGELENYSGHISSIVNVIKAIADQTNLLALNAAIEAARAGEQGRGFAVVADEVRTLANRTGKSTQEITGMISKIQAGIHRAVNEMETSVRLVDQGVTLTEKAGSSITSIRTNNQQLIERMDEITHTLKEQIFATREISSKVENIANSAEKTDTLVKRTVLSANNMENIAKQLRVLAGKFNI